MYCIQHIRNSVLIIVCWFGKFKCWVAYNIWFLISTLILEYPRAFCLIKFAHLVLENLSSRLTDHLPVKENPLGFFKSTPVVFHVPVTAKPPSMMSHLDTGSYSSWLSHRACYSGRTGWLSSASIGQTKGSSDLLQSTWLYSPLVIGILIYGPFWRVVSLRKEKGYYIHLFIYFIIAYWYNWNCYIFLYKSCIR